MNVMKRLVDRFLAWSLPKDFSPDAGVSFKPTIPDGHGTHWWPTGTNLLTAEQAQQMFEYVIGKGLTYEASTEGEGDAYTHGYFDGLETGCARVAAERELTGNLVETLTEINNWLVCAAFATPEDMAQSFHAMQQLADAAVTAVAAIREKEL